MYAEVNGTTLVTFPYDYDTLCKKNPSTAFPPNVGLLELYMGTEANLAGNELAAVTEEPQPSFDPATQQVAQNASPTLSGGQWVLGWTVSTMTPEQQAAAESQKADAVRADRNNRLAASDWTQVADSPVDKAAWATYRQELRDVPNQQGFPWNVVWPSEP